MTIKEIESRIVEFRLQERSLLEKRRKARTPLLYNAEKHPLVNRLADDLYSRALGLPLLKIERYSQPGRCVGREDEEFLSEVSVILSAREVHEACGGACSDVMLTVKLISGFEDVAAREEEKKIMDELEAIRYTIRQLVERKRLLKETTS